MTDDKVFGLLMKVGIPIGSRAWGGFTEKSDYDIVISQNRYEKILVFLKDKGYHFKKHFGGDYGVVGHVMFNTSNDKIHLFGGNVVINIISYETKDIPKIKELNKIMDFLKTTTVGERMALDKNYRIIMVESILSVLFHATKSIDLGDSDIPF